VEHLPSFSALGLCRNFVGRLEAPLCGLESILKKKVFVCTEGKSCSRRGGEDLFLYLRTCAETPLYEDHYKVKPSDCLGMCKHGPSIWIKNDGIKYGALNELIGSLILEHHFRHKKPMKDLFYKKKKKK
jgi:(2Fe-2S) ferredoxin